MDKEKRTIYLTDYDTVRGKKFEEISSEKYLKLLSKSVENGETINDELVPIYIQNQKKDLRLSFKDIKDYFHNFKNDIIKSKEETSNIINNKIWPFCQNDLEDIFWDIMRAGFSLFIVVAGIKFIFPSYFLRSNLGLFLGTFGAFFGPGIVTFSIPVFTYIYRHIKNRIERLSGFINRRKFTKQKIKSLTQGNSKVILEDVAKIANDNSIENNDDKEDDSLRITKLILKEFDSIVKKVKSINDESIQKEFLKKINDLFNEFNERIKGIEKVDNSFDLNLDGYQALKKDMIVKLETINLELEEILEKSLRSKQIFELTNEFEQKIETLNNSLYETRKRGK